MIRINAQAEVSGTLIRLGDVADVREVDEADRNRLLAIELAPAPAAGRSLQLEFALLRSRLVAHGVNLSDVEFSGSAVVAVHSKADLQPRTEPAKPVFDGVSESQAKRAEQTAGELIHRHLRGAHPELGEFFVYPAVPREGIEMLQSAVTVQWKVTGGQPPWNRPQDFVLFTGFGETAQKVVLSARLVPWPMVVVAKHDVPRGHQLRKDDLAWKQVERADGGLQDWQAAVGRETTRNLRASQPIAAEDIRNVPLVRSNDIVTVYSRRPGISVKRQFKARGDGAFGETVPLVSLDGKQRLSGRVVGFHEVEVSRATQAVGSSPQNGHIQFLPADGDDAASFRVSQNEFGSQGGRR